MTPELIIAGNLLVDDLVFENGQTRMGEAGGAVLHAALAARLWGIRSGCVSWRGQDYPADALDALAQRGVDLHGVHELGRPGVRTWLLYEGGLRQMVPRLGRPAHEEVSPTLVQFPPDWAGARACHVAPMPFASQRALVSGLSAVALVSLDPHRPITESTLPAWREVLAQVDVLLAGEDELRLDGLAEAPQATLQRLAGGRLCHVLCKRGAAGGLLYDVPQDRLVPWQPWRTEVIDPTGAGDAFAAGFLSGLLAGATADEALGRGVVSARFAMADWGARGLLATSPEEAQRHLGAWRVGAGSARWP